VTGLFTDIRKTALLAFFGMVVGNIPALWNSAQSTIQLGATNPAVKPWVIPIILFGASFAAISPVFCLAVYRDEGRLLLA
jgi:hypothetical protein